MPREVVVTGLGCVTAIGLDVEGFWEGLLTGRSGASPVVSFDTSALKNHIGCEVRGYVPEAEVSPAGEPVARASQMAITAAHQALGDAGVRPGAEMPPHRIGVVVGSTMGDLSFLDDLVHPCLRGEAHDAPWEDVIRQSCDAMPRHVALALGADGPTLSIPTACSAGNYAIGYGFDLIRRGDADVVVAGASDAFSASTFVGFTRLNAMSPDLCRPFDLHRKGLLLGEGAGAIVLEDADSARRRSAPVYARVLGYGLSCDAHHMTSPHPAGTGAAAAMLNAMRHSEVGLEDIDYICCHGTGTTHNDRIETVAIHRVLGERARAVPASSIKALVGHAMGAASALEAIACALAIARHVLPPTWNHETPDPDCDLDVIPNEPREADPVVVLNNSYAFGGNNACLVLGRA